MQRFTRLKIPPDIMQSKVIEGLNSKIVSSNFDPEQNEIIHGILDHLPCNESPKLKSGIKLLKTDTQWKKADVFQKRITFRRHK